MAPRPSPAAGIPSESDEARGLRLQLTQHLAQMRALFSQLMSSVGTIDTVIYEHDTQELPTTQATFTLNLAPQTTQTEFITGLFAAITVPDLVAAPTITIENAWAKLGGDYINLNAILNSAGGTGGAIPGTFKYVLSSASTRQLNIVASADWPSGAYVTFALFGEAVPTMSGGVLH